MGTLRIVLTVVYIIVCIALTVIVLAQEGKNQGLGALQGSTDTYWSKNKGRSKEGKLLFFSRILAALFIILSAVLNLSKF